MALLKTEKFWNMAGAILGVIVLLVGIIFMCTPPETYSTRSAESVTFGADYYTYQYEATKYAVSNTAITANNIRELGKAISGYAGFGFVVAGLLITMNYGKKLVMALPETPTAVAPIAEETNNNAAAE